MAMQDGKVLLIANPAAQRGNGTLAARIAYDLLCEWIGGESVELAETKQPLHAVSIASSATTDHFDTVIALGGDGIVHEVVNGLMQIDAGSRPAFGLIPVGSGNDYARTLGMSESVPDAVVQFLDAREVQADIGCCNGEYFAETLSFGLDAAIALDTVERRMRTGEQGTTLYLKSGLNQLLHHLDVYHATATLDGTRTIDVPTLMFAVQVGPTYSGGFRICPGARIDDGMFDICYAEAPMRIPVATFKFLSAKNAHHVGRKGICFERASTIELSFDRRPPCQIDGEAHIADSYSISTCPAALRVIQASNAR